MKKIIMVMALLGTTALGVHASASTKNLVTNLSAAEEHYMKPTKINFELIKFNYQRDL